MEPVKISATVLTLNEAHNIRDCVESLRPVADEILVVDSFSTDGTEAICRELGVRFLQHAFEGFIEQRRYAAEMAAHDIILAVEADERVTPELAHAILEAKGNWSANGYTFNRLNNYGGKWLRYAWYPDRKLRLWDRRRGEVKGANPHDQIVVEGEPRQLRGDLLHYAYAHIGEHAAQAAKFSRTAALSKLKARPEKWAGFWPKVVLNPCFTFIKLYVLKRGFLDGKHGLIYCALAAYINFLKYAQLWELQKKRSSNQ